MSRHSFEQSRRSGGGGGSSNLQTLMYRQNPGVVDLSVDTSFTSSQLSPAHQNQSFHQYETGSNVDSETSSNYRYRNDYSRSQHTAMIRQQQQQQQKQQQQQRQQQQQSNNKSPGRQQQDPPEQHQQHQDQHLPYYHEESTLPLSPEQVRFEKYVNRFAAHDPRSSPVRRRSNGQQQQERISVSERISRFQSAKRVVVAASVQSAPATTTAVKGSGAQPYFAFPETDDALASSQPHSHFRDPQMQSHPATMAPMSRKSTNGSLETNTTATSHSTRSSSAGRSRRTLSPERSSREATMTPGRFTRPRAPSSRVFQAAMIFANHRSYSFDERRLSFEPEQSERNLPPPTVALVEPPASTPAGRYAQRLQQQKQQRQQQQQQQEQQQQQQQQFHTPIKKKQSPSALRPSTRAIESPAARVTALRSKLWDNNETLKVSVQPSLHYVRNRRDAAPEEDPFGLSKSTSSSSSALVPDVAISITTDYNDNASDSVVPFRGPEMAGRSGQRVSRSLSPKRPQYRNSAFKSRFYEAALASRRPVAADRIENERFQAATAATAATAANNADRIENERFQAQGREQRGATPVSQTTVAEVVLEDDEIVEITRTATTPTRQRGVESPATSAAEQQQQFYRHQIQPSPRWRSEQQQQQPQQQLQPPPKEDIQPQQPKEVTQQPKEVVQHYVPQAAATSPNRNTWRQQDSTLVPTATREVWRNQPSLIDERSEGTGEASVAKLVARLNSINRSNPAAALAQIDSILRAESKSSSSSPVRPSQEQQPELEEEKKAEDIDYDAAAGDESEDDDDETSVSSITNPTYAGIGGSPKHIQDQLLMNSSRRPKPNALQSYQQQVSAATTLEQQQQQAKRKAKKERKLPIPIESISVKESSSTTIGNKNRFEPIRDNEADDDGDDGIIERTESLGRLDQHVIRTMSSSEPPNAATIAMKIRAWDELSGSASKSKATYEEAELISAATEELGSIITPNTTQMMSSPLPPILTEPRYLSPEPPSPVQYDDEPSTDQLSPVQHDDDRQQYDRSPASPQSSSPRDLSSNRGRSFEREDEPPQRDRSRTLSVTPRRYHPWDHHHPRHKPSPNRRFADTSMEDGEGIEFVKPASETKAKQQQQQLPSATSKMWNVLREQEPPVASQTVVAAPIAQTRSAVQIRNQEIVEQEVSTVRSAAPLDTSGFTGDFGFTGDDFAVDPQLLKSNDEFDFPTRIKEQGETQTSKFSDDFDAAWVALPPSAFEPERQKSSNKYTANVEETPIQRRLSDRQQRIRDYTPGPQNVVPVVRGRDSAAPSRPETPPLLAYTTDSTSPESTTEVTKSPRRRKFNLLKMKKSHDAMLQPNNIPQASRDDAMVPIITTTRSASKSPGRRQSPNKRRGSPGGRDRSGSYNIVQKFNRLRRSQTAESRSDEAEF